MSVHVCSSMCLGLGFLNISNIPIIGAQNPYDSKGLGVASNMDRYLEHQDTDPYIISESLNG